MRECLTSPERQITWGSGRISPVTTHMACDPDANSPTIFEMGFFYSQCIQPPPYSEPQVSHFRFDDHIIHGSAEQLYAAIESKTLSRGNADLTSIQLSQNRSHKKQRVFASSWKHRCSSIRL